MAHTKGRLGQLAVDDGGGFDTVGGITSMSLSSSHDTIDETDFDSAGYKESAYGETQLTISVTYLRDEADAGQDALRAADSGKTTVSARYRPTVAAGADQITFTAKVNSLERSNERNADVEETVELESSGSITYDTQ
jgi:predicted secreted protein